MNRDVNGPEYGVSTAGSGYTATSEARNKRSTRGFGLACDALAGVDGLAKVQIGH